MSLDRPLLPFTVSIKLSFVNDSFHRMQILASDPKLQIAAYNSYAGSVNGQLPCLGQRQRAAKNLFSMRLTCMQCAPKVRMWRFTQPR